MILQTMVLERWIYHAAIEVQNRISTTPPMVMKVLHSAAYQKG